MYKKLFPEKQVQLILKNATKAYMTRTKKTKQYAKYFVHETKSFACDLHFIRMTYYFSISSNFLNKLVLRFFTIDNDERDLIRFNAINQS